MSDDATFLAVIRASPDDNTARLAYADWLDEQGRPECFFLCVECEIADLDRAEFERRGQERAKLREEGVIDSTPPDPLDTYYWRRVDMVARLGCTARGLDADWMATVSRVPIEEINARLREIQSWLRLPCARCGSELGVMVQYGGYLLHCPACGGSLLYKLVFQPNVGAPPFLFGSAREALRKRVWVKPTVIPSEPQYDKYGPLGLFLGYDTADRLNYIEVFAPSTAHYDGDDLNSVPMEELTRKLADEKRYYNLGGALIFTKYGIVLGEHGDIRSASLFTAGLYDASIAEFGADRLLRHVT